jgi:hybrid polyketide synthase/nonribosomal peptide synthetase ACE1
MPPIAGVAQGAMVLQDTMFIDLDLSRLEKVLLPKVEGSIILDELFSDNTLDFLIFFSSMAAITGNQGQVAYNAANMFMTSLASQRQKRGLRGQAIHIGAIVGNGYVTRELNMAQQTFLYRMGHTWMSEQDFHEVFAEGVLTSADNGESSQICSGLRIDDDLSKGWVTSPMFQHLVFKESILPTEQSKDKGAVVLKLRLLEASSHQEVINILEGNDISEFQISTYSF